MCRLKQEEWLDAEAVVGDEEGSSVVVPHSNGPHAIEPLEAVRSPMGQRGEHDFGIRIRSEHTARKRAPVPEAPKS